MPASQGADPQPGPRDQEPLGGIRGAAAAGDGARTTAASNEYTQVIIHEADRLQSLVDRLLAPTATRESGGRREHPRVRSGCARWCWPSSRKGLRAARLRHLDLEFPRRPRAAHPGGAQHRPQRGCRRCPSASSTAMRDHAAHARAGGRSRSGGSATGWHWTCMSTTDPACRAGDPRTAFFTRWFPAAGRRIGAGADAGANLRPAAPAIGWTDRVGPIFQC